MPFAVALLCHPLGTFASLVAAIVATLYAAQSHRFLPAFTAVSAALLTLLAFLQVPPSTAALAWLFIGVVLLHVEFLRPTFGFAGLLGVGAAAWGSCSLLAPLEPIVRGAAALLGALMLLAAVARTMRLRTLPQLPTSLSTKQ
jgi:membrane-bound ClpP family serine protease